MRDPAAIRWMRGTSVTLAAMRTHRAIPMLIASLGVASTAQGQTPPGARDSDAACTAAYTSGQRLRKKGELLAARKQLTSCASPACSPVLRDDCTRWLAEITSLIPSLVIAARGPSGDDAMEVRVLVDGSLLADRIGGVPLEVDPGPHRLRFEMQGAQPVEKEVVVREGERARRIDVAFVPASASTPTETTPAEPQQPVRPVPTLAWVLGGVGAAALVVGIGFEIDGLTRRSTLGACFGGCSADDVNAAKRSFAIGDVSTGVGVAALAAAAFVFFTRPPSQAPAASALGLDVVPTRQGAMAGVRGAF
jgi:hypothetical protein